MIRNNLSLLAVILIFVASAQAGERFPAGSWQQYTAPEEAGFSSAQLEKARQFWESSQSAAVMVVYDGAVLAAWGDLERRFMLHSVRKSLMSALYGIHVAAGQIDLEKTMGELGIDDTNPTLNDEEKQARILDLIRARSGVYHAAAAEPPQNSKPARGSHPPGSHWCYNNWDFNALGTIFEKETGCQIFEEFYKRFAVPLGMQDFRVRDGFYMHELDKSSHPAYHFRMSARDMARFGLLFLENGNWNGRQILTNDWVRTSTSAHSNDAWGISYGFMWWVNTLTSFAELGMYSALGVGEQSIDVIPGARMVVVVRTDTYAGNKLSSQDRLKLIRMIVDARTADPKARPKLEALPSDARPIKTAKLTARFKKDLCGEYEIPSFGTRGRLYLDKKDLVLETPMGTFGLIPLSKKRFMLEDVHDQYCLAKNVDGSPNRLYTEYDCIMMGYQHLQAEATDKALAIFQKAVEIFPESFNTHDSLGEAYAKKGLIRQAIDSYEKSIELNPKNTGGMEKLRELRDQLNNG